MGEGFSNNPSLQQQVNVMKPNLRKHSVEGDVVISASLSASADSSMASRMGLLAWDIETGSPLMSFKGNSTLPGGLAVVDNYAIYSLQSSKAVVYDFIPEKDSAHGKSTLPERMKCMVAVGGTRLLCGGAASGKVYLWDSATGVQLGSFSAHGGAVTAITATPDGAFLLTAGVDCALCWWSVSDCLECPSRVIAPLIRTVPGNLPLTAVVATDRVVLVTCGDSSCHLYSSPRGLPLHTWMAEGGGVPNTAALSPLLSSFVVGFDSGEIHGMDLVPQPGGRLSSEWTYLTKLHTAAITAISFSSNGRMLVASSMDGTISVWRSHGDVNLTLQYKNSLHGGPVSALQIMPYSHWGRMATSSLSSFSSSMTAGKRSQHSERDMLHWPVKPLEKDATLLRMLPTISSNGGGGGAIVPSSAFASTLPLPLPIWPTSDGCSSIGGATGTATAPASAGADNDNATVDSANSQPWLQTLQSLLAASTSAQPNPTP